jgi:hypothetical protein
VPRPEQKLTRKTNLRVSLSLHRPEVWLILALNVNQEGLAIRTDNHQVNGRMIAQGQSHLIAPFAKLACDGKLSGPLRLMDRTFLSFLHLLPPTFARTMFGANALASGLFAASLVELNPSGAP